VTERRSIPPAPLEPDRYPSAFETRIAPAYWIPFANRLAEALSGHVAANDKVLELGCVAGHGTLELQKLVPDGRVVAIEPRKLLLDLARDRAGRLGGKRIFFKMEELEHTTFADAAFDAVVSNLPLEGPGEPGPLLAEARRLVAKGGTLAITVALEGTWSVVLDVYEEVCERFEFPGALGRLALVRERMPAPAIAAARLERLGLSDVSVTQFSFSIRFRNARELLRDELVLAGPIRDWRTIAGDDTAWERAAFHLRETMDTYFASRAIDVPIHGGIVVGKA
jgi:SAM-dependent methyltransferase